MYNHKEVEKKWQEFWEKNKTFKTENDFSKPKWYSLDMFPYPSGAGLHVGHPEGFTANDILARYKHALWYNVLHPMWWDAFWLPAENYAIKTWTHPRITTNNNIHTFKTQLKKLGFSYDWDREIDTTDPDYYKWTQWIFLKLFEHGLAYEQDLPINYCPSCKTGLANEEVLNDFTCERCGTKVEKKKIRQWVLAITKYAERLLNDVDKLDWPEGIKDMQRNWIGKSEGCEFELKKYIEGTGTQENKIPVPSIRVYTTRVDTVFGMTYAVLAPDHKDVNDYITDKYRKECESYIKKANSMSDQDRTADDKEKTGVFTGSYVINPFNGEKVPLWIADYVLWNYWTWAVMAVPAHDIRDFEFAKKYDLPIKQSIANNTIYTWKSAPKDWLATLYKKTVDVILENDKWEILLQIEKEWNIEHIHFVWWWIEEWEQELEALKRELTEETGYTDFEIIWPINLSYSRAYWYRHTKDKNQDCTGRCYYIKLNSEEKIHSEIDEWKHTIRWVKKEEVSDLISWAGHLKLWKLFYEWEKALTEDWILVNSNEFDWLNSQEARQKLTEYATKNWFWTKKINYKLRDWLFSRQRYWGEPIPLIHLENNDVEKLINFNFYYENVIDSIISWVKTVETRALNPEEPNRYFWNIKIGDVVTFTDKTKDIKYLVKINEVKTWKDIEELYKDKENLEKVLSEKKEVSLEELKKLYAYTPDYVERIEKNWLIGFSFEVISKIYDWLYGKIICDYNLPLKLPEVENYEPAWDWNSPLVKVADFVNIKLANNLSGKRETNTMPQWGWSCWYYLRFMDPKNSSELVNREVEKYWGQVDSYVWWAEHAVLHLLYARFWHKFLFDIKIVSHDEPFFRLRNQWLILAHAFQRKNWGLLANDLVEEKNWKYYEIATGEELNRIVSKMSKSLKNVINPDDIVEDFWADSLRLYEMYMAEFKDTAPWDTKWIVWVKRFLEKSERLFTSEAKISTEDDNSTLKLLHKTIKKVGEDIENYKFNTGIAAMMILVNNWLPKDIKLQKEWKNIFVRLLHPFAPHLAEELWANMWEKESVFFSIWPKYDENLVKDDVITIWVQVLWKLRWEIEIWVDEDEKTVLEKARNNESVKKWLDWKVIVKEIYVKLKIVNIVVR